MKDINILINENHSVSFDDDYVGLNRENLQGNIVFKFKNFVDGNARAEVIIGDEEGYILLEKVGQTYTMPIKSSLLKDDFIIMQLVIDQAPIGEEYPIWKSECFTLKVGKSINATSTIPDDYPSWVAILEELKNETQQAITQAENLNITSEQLTDGVKVITTDKNGEQTITIVPQGLQGEPGVPGAIKMLVVAELPETGADDTIYLVPITPDTSGNNYAEYVYINGAWELLGKIGVQVDLTDYVKNTDYATDSTGGVIKTGWSWGTAVNSSGQIYCSNKNYTQYSGSDNAMFISKGTLENVITGKGLVSNTNYATENVAGVIKIGGSGRTLLGGNNQLLAPIMNYSTYTSAGDYSFIGKATLENVLTARIGDIQTLLDALDSGSGV